MSAPNVPTALDMVDGIDLGGKTCVITGATSGLGRESARALATAGAHVVLAARNPGALTEAADWIRTEVPGSRVSTVLLDLASLAGVRTAAKSISRIAPAIDVLMNNAGVMFTPFGRTADGFEMQFGTNHLGHFELTRLLVPQLSAAAAARVVILSSDGHTMADIDLDDPNWERRGYDKFLAYGASKTANVLHMVELDRRLSSRGIRAYCVHPGVVATSLARHMTRDDFAALSDLTPAQPNRRAERIDVLHDFVLPDQGAATQVWAAVSPELAGVGSVYLADCRIRPEVASYAVDPHRAAQLWELSESLCS
ncbi:SDR family NAD(P)-dependent oxidoreductase [Mycobacterium sp. DL440]|uniref:SDR family NAD(P)-dependent oxidoreductase n=1 Tax=Mycobacterium sp. DL440 TaxID=2675523 RepID=UPI0014227C4E|nr:SDR family NAD(P)-dependent oxidoreductase [Mycobacterium sp. DL440]